jgi:predicted Zn-dependent peptidase
MPNNFTAGKRDGIIAQAKVKEYEKKIEALEAEKKKMEEELEVLKEEAKKRDETKQPPPASEGAVQVPGGQGTG